MHLNTPSASPSAPLAISVTYPVHKYYHIVSSDTLCLCHCEGRDQTVQRLNYIITNIISYLFFPKTLFNNVRISALKGSLKISHTSSHTVEVLRSDKVCEGWK